MNRDYKKLQRSMIGDEYISISHEDPLRLIPELRALDWFVSLLVRLSTMVFDIFFIELVVEGSDDAVEVGLRKVFRPLLIFLKLNFFCELIRAIRQNKNIIVYHFSFFVLTSFLDCVICFQQLLLGPYDLLSFVGVGIHQFLSIMEHKVLALPIMPGILMGFYCA